MTVSSQSLDTPKSAPKPLMLGGVVLALSAPLITGILNGYFDAWFDNNGRVLAGALSFWLIVGLVLLLTRLEANPVQQTAERGLWHSIGFKRAKLRESLIVLIIAFVTLFFANLAFVVLSRTIFPTEIKTHAALALPLPLVILVYSLSIAEEILYRGYALERLQRMTGNWWISGGITWVLFVGFHIPAYPMAAIVGYGAPAAVVITLIYIWKRNLTYTAMMHCVLNLPILLGAILLAVLPTQ